MKHNRSAIDSSIQTQLQIERQREEKLLLKLLKRKAKLEKLQNEKRRMEKERDRFKRRYMEITRNRMWRYTWPLRKGFEFLNKVKETILNRSLGHKNRSLLQQNKKLLEEKAKLQAELEKAHHKLREKTKRLGTQIVEWQEYDDEELRTSLRTIKEDGTIIDYLERLIDQRKMHDKNYRSALVYAAQLYKDERMDVRHLVYKKVLSGLKVEEVPEVIMRSDEKKEMVDLSTVSSFRARLTMQLRLRQLTALRPEWMLDHKTTAYTFIDSLGVPRPWTAPTPYSLSNLLIKEGTVIKPALGGGSRGVYLILNSNNIQDLKRSRQLLDINALKASMKEDLASGWVRHDEWIVEELLFEDEEAQLPARDIKFYCFYGKVALILEIQRYPDTKYCWWGPHGDRIHTGKYEERLFEGDGVSQDQIELAASISSEIPTPFIRVDFLKTSKGLVFGEFTPKPGNYDQFDHKTDQLLGEYFIEAEGRLLTDLLNEKPFEHFKKLL